jgi:streptogramin lyase
VLRPACGCLITTLILALAGCGGGGDDPASTSAATSTTTTTNAEVQMVDLRKAGATTIKLDGDWLIGSDDAVWITAGTEIDRLDPETGKPTGKVSVPGGPCLGGAYAYGALFIPTCYSEEGLVKVDPESLEVTEQVELGTPDIHNQEGSIAAGEGAVWMIVDGKGCEACVLVGLDPDTLRTTHQIDLDPGAGSVAVGNGYVWVTELEPDRLLRIDARTDEILSQTKIGALAKYLTVDDNGVWVINQLDGTVMQLSPDDGELLKTIEADMAGAGGSITAGGGSVWVRGTLTLLKQIDSESGEIVTQYGPDEGSGDALVSDGVLWVSAFRPGHGTGPGSGIVYRLPLAATR